MAVTNATIHGYQASAAIEWEEGTPRLYQSRSLPSQQAESATFEKRSGICSNQFSDYAQTHAAFPNHISPSKLQVAVSPVSPVSSTSSYYSTLHHEGSTQLSIELDCLKPISLSPSLQSAAARAPPPSSALNTGIPRLAPFRPSQAASASPPHLPGPQELIQSTSQNNNVRDVALQSEFGHTTKIVPLPVTTTRPLPLIERKTTEKPPVVTLTTDQYALRSTVTRVLGSNSYQPRESAGRADTSGNVVHMLPQNGSTPQLSGFNAPPNAILNVQAGFTSVNPGGRSYSEKKTIYDFLGTQQPSLMYRSVQNQPLDHAPAIPPGFTSQAPVGKSYSEGKRKKAKIPPLSGEQLREEQRRQAEMYNNALRSRQTRPPGPVIVPVTSNDPVRTRKSGSLKSQYQASQETDSPSMRSVDREMTMDSMETLPGNDDNYSNDRPAICSFNPVHPLYEKRILKGEITSDIVCDKRFTRKSDCVRHERIHVNDRPFTCVIDGCNKSFIQRSALTVHIRTHTGEKPHVCDVCSKCFTDSSSLARHRRTHNGVQPYRCTAPHCKQAFSRKFSLSKHFHSTHSDLPIPPELSFVLHTQRQMAPEQVLPASTKIQSVDLDANVVESGSDLSSVTGSDETDDDMDPDSSPVLIRETVDGKTVKVYENDAYCDSKGKDVKVYHPRREVRHTTTTQLAPVVTAPPGKKRKYESAEVMHATSKHEVTRPRKSGVNAGEYLRQGPSLTTRVHSYSQPDGGRRAPRGAKSNSTLSTTRDEIAWPLGTIHGPSTLASANAFEYPSRSRTMHSVKHEVPSGPFHYGENTHQPVYLSMQTSAGDLPFPPTPPVLRQAFTNSRGMKPAKNVPKARIQGYQSDNPLSMDPGKQSPAYATTEYQHRHFGSARNLSQRASLPVFTDNLDSTSSSARSHHINSVDSAITMVDSPTEGMMVDEEESKEMDI